MADAGGTRETPSSDAPRSGYLAGGPLPFWTPMRTDEGSRAYEATDPSGEVWRLTPVWSSDPDRIPPEHYRLAPRDAPENHVEITGDRGLHFALDMAGLRIADDEVRKDPDRARRQMSLPEDALSDLARFAGRDDAQSAAVNALHRTRASESSHRSDAGTARKPARTSGTRFRREL